MSEFIYGHFENRILLKPVLGRGGGGGGGGMRVVGVAHCIAGHEQTPLNRVYYFHFFGVFLASKGSRYSELIYLSSQKPVS